MLTTWGLVFSHQAPRLLVGTIVCFFWAKLTMLEDHDNHGTLDGKSACILPVVKMCHSQQKASDIYGEDV